VQVSVSGVAEGIDHHAAALFQGGQPAGKFRDAPDGNGDVFVNVERRVAFLDALGDLAAHLPYPLPDVSFRGAQDILRPAFPADPGHGVDLPRDDFRIPVGLDEQERTGT